MLVKNDFNKANRLIINYLNKNGFAYLFLIKTFDKNR